ncbi:MAG: hypothetical protein ACOC26_01855 [Halochromatium sp.]
MLRKVLHQTLKKQVASARHEDGSMKLCKTCFSSPWPFVMVTGIAIMAGFVTWLTLGLSQPEPQLRLAAGLIAFVAVEVTLIHYVISCMRRHCRHHAHGAQRSRHLSPES